MTTTEVEKRDPYDVSLSFIESIVLYCQSGACVRMAQVWAENCAATCGTTLKVSHQALSYHDGRLCRDYQVVVYHGGEAMLVIPDSYTGHELTYFDEQVAAWVEKVHEHQGLAETT